MDAAGQVIDGDQILAVLALALKTTAQRAQPLAGPDPFYSANLVQVVQMTEITDNKNKDRMFVLTIKLDKKIPVDSGYVDVSSNASKSQATDQPKPKSADAKSEPNRGGGHQDRTAERQSFALAAGGDARSERGPSSGQGKESFEQYRYC